MNDLDRFLNKWEETKSVQALLDSRLSLPDPETTRLHLSALPIDKQAEINTVLNDVVTAMSLYLQTAKGEAADIRGQINQQTQNAIACLSYNNSQRPPSK